MDHDDLVDPTIVLSPVEEAGEPATRRRLAFYAAIGCAVLLSIGAMAVVIAKVAGLVRSAGATVVVSAERDSPAFRQESAAIFSRFDAVEDFPLEDAEGEERDAIGALFRQLETAAAAEDHAAFRRLVDYDRLVKRVELAGSMQGWNWFERRTVRAQLRASSEAEPFWGKLVIAGVVAPQDDPATRIVYAYGWDASTSDETENRFWIARDGGGWKLYDWERLDLGMPESRIWGLCIRHADTHVLAGFQRWVELVEEADTLTSSMDYDAAKERLRVAEQQLVPPELDDYRWLLTAYRWAALQEMSEAERCYHRVARPDEMPGVYFGLMQCLRWKNPDQALKNIERYEAIVGPTVGLLETKAELLEGMGRKVEAAEDWSRLLRIQPDNSSALAKLFLSLPKEDKSAFFQALDRVEDPVAAVAGIASSVGYEDYDGLLTLAEHLERTAPGTAGAHYVAGFAAYLDGQYEKTAELYRLAYEATGEDEQGETYIHKHSYLDAMAAAGEVLAAWENAPDPKEAFRYLADARDVGEVALTADDFAELLRLYRERFPDEPDAVYRQSQLAVERKDYVEAERLLRETLEFAETDWDEETVHTRESAVISLAHVLSKQGRLAEAYRLEEDRQQRFYQLAMAAIYDNRWDDVRWLLDQHRPVADDEPKMHMIQGELAAHEKRWDDAIRHFREGLAAASDDSHWRLSHRLVEVCVESGRWLEYYTSSDDYGEAFEKLADGFVSAEDWDGLSALIAEHRQRSPDDGRLAKYEAEAAWGREDYAAFSRLAISLLTGRDDTVNSYERHSLERRLLSSLLRRNALDQALQWAQSKQDEESDSAALAIVHAAAGNLAAAEWLARGAAMRKDSAFELYWHTDAGHIFLHEAFGDLHRDFPVELPYASTAPTLAVFLGDELWTLDAARINAALQSLGIDATAATLKTGRNGVKRAFALRLDNASIWLATGEGSFDAKWQIDNESSPLAAPLNGSRAWLAVGTAAWSESDRQHVEKVARRLAPQLVEGQARVICAKGRQLWDDFYAYPISDELIAAWESSGKLDEFKNQAAKLEKTDRDDDTAAKREFDRKLREAVRLFESTDGNRLEVVFCLSDNPQLDPVRLTVDSVRRRYGGLELDGVLQSNSALIPQLKAGLPMRLQQYEIGAWRLNDEPPVYRRPAGSLGAQAE